MVLTADQKLQIPSKPENVILIEKLINDVCESFKVNEDCYGNILVAITEAVTNAIVHGNKSDPAKNVEITFSPSPDALSFIIKDEGAGFDFNNLPDPTDPENLEKLNGRGVFLMRNLADKTSFSDNGKTVKLDFSLKKATA